MADIDHFKQYNDTNGHLSGDTLLRKIAVIFLECSRDIDVVARYGGEEFIIIMPETDEKEARSCAERIRARITATVFPHASTQPEGQLTISFGVCGLSEQMKDVSDFVEKADQALYRAKNLGRNRVET
jgi:diguanylate cyclase (GGDEF)-like protein